MSQDVTFTGPRRVAIREFGYLQGANAKISELTGARFGPGYARLIADGSFVMDSEAAARGIAALRRAAPDRIVELAAARQHAFYVDGLSLSDPAIYRAVAEAGLDPQGVVADFTAPDTAAAAQDDFTRAAGLGVHGFPTLLAVDGEHAVSLAAGPTTADEIDRRLATLTIAS